MAEFKYKVELERELDPSCSSIAASELCSCLSIMEGCRNDEVKYYKVLAYSKELQMGLFEMEKELKAEIRRLKTRLEV